MESTLHRQLKEHFAAGGLVEVVEAGYRYDARTPDGTIVEVQTSPLLRIRAKLRRLLEVRTVRLVIPVVHRKQIAWIEGRRTPREVSRRYSPARRETFSVFDELVSLGPLLAHPALQLAVARIHTVESRRRDRRYRSGFTVVDRALERIEEVLTVGSPVDYARLLPGPLPEPFTTHDLATAWNIPLHAAQRVAYCLRHAGTVRPTGKRSRFGLYTTTRSDAGMVRAG